MTRSSKYQKQRQVGVWSRRNFAELDQRLIEAKEERRVITELTAYVGGNPSVPQVLLIKRTARLLLMISALERRALEGNDLGDLAGRQIVALHNALRRSLAELGAARPEVRPPRLADVLKVA